MNVDEQKEYLKKVAATSAIVQNLQGLVNGYDKRHPHWFDAIKEYDVFMASGRPWWMAQVNNDYEKLLKNEEFVRRIRELVAIFGMNVRGSKLTSPSLFLETIIKASQDFNSLVHAHVRLENLNFKTKIEAEPVNSIISRTYNLFSKMGSLSASGGMVVASKTMHMILPELFIMVDRGIMRRLHQIKDYQPHPKDGRNWYDVIPGYLGDKLNCVESGWTVPRTYLAALIYYKRIIFEWCEQSSKDVKDFLEIGTRTVRIDPIFGKDTSYQATAARIVDMALW